jgi:hypothetical protein
MKRINDSVYSLLNDWDKIVLWIFSNTTGWSLGLTFGLTTWSKTVTIIYENPKLMDIASIQHADFFQAEIIGSLIAIFQGIFSLIYKRNKAFTIKWTIGTFAGVFLGLFCAKLLNQPIISYTDGGLGYPTFLLGGMGFAFWGLFNGIILGGFIAFCQVLILYKHVSSKILWITANAIGVQFAFFFTFFIPTMNVLFVGALIGFLYGLITTLPLRHLPYNKMFKQTSEVS